MVTMEKHTTPIRILRNKYTKHVPMAKTTLWSVDGGAMGQNSQILEYLKVLIPSTHRVHATTANRPIIYMFTFNFARAVCQSLLFKTSLSEVA